MDPFELITAPPRLTARALDDLHTLAQLARHLQARLDLLDRLDERTREMVAIGEQIDAHAETLLGIVTRIEGVVIATNDRAQFVTKPLEGAVERLGRVVADLSSASRSTQR